MMEINKVIEEIVRVHYDNEHPNVFKLTKAKRKRKAILIALLKDKLKSMVSSSNVIERNCRNCDEPVPPIYGITCPSCFCDL